MNVIHFDGGDHVLHLLAGTDVDTPGSANVRQALDERRFNFHTAKEANDGDDTFVLDSVETLLQRTGATDLDDDVDTDAARQLLGRLTPVLVFPVVQHVIGAELSHDLLLVLGRGRRDDSCAGGFGEL